MTDRAPFAYVQFSPDAAPTFSPWEVAEVNRSEERARDADRAGLRVLTPLLWSHDVEPLRVVRLPGECTMMTLQERVEYELAINGITSADACEAIGALKLDKREDFTKLLAEPASDHPMVFQAFLVLEALRHIGRLDLVEPAAKP